MRLLLIVLAPLFLCACGGYELKNLAKSDIDLVTDQFIAKMLNKFLDEHQKTTEQCLNYI